MQCNTLQKVQSWCSSWKVSSCKEHSAIIQKFRRKTKTIWKKFRDIRRKSKNFTATHVSANWKVGSYEELSTYPNLKFKWHISQPVLAYKAQSIGVLDTAQSPKTHIPTWNSNWSFHRLLSIQLWGVTIFWEGFPKLKKLSGISIGKYLFGQLYYQFMGRLSKVEKVVCYLAGKYFFGRLYYQFLGRLPKVEKVVCFIDWKISFWATILPAIRRAAQSWQC